MITMEASIWWLSQVFIVSRSSEDPPQLAKTQWGRQKHRSHPASHNFHIFQQWVPAALPTWYLPLSLVFVPLVATVALGVLVRPLEKDAIQLKLEAVLLVPNWIVTMVECEVYADKDTYQKTTSESDGQLHCKHNMYKHTRILWGEKWTIWTVPVKHLKVTMPYWEARPGQQLHASRPWFGPCACDFRVMPMNYLWLFSCTPVTLLYVSR